MKMILYSQFSQLLTTGILQKPAYVLQAMGSKAPRWSSTTFSRRTPHSHSTPPFSVSLLQSINRHTNRVQKWHPWALFLHLMLDRAPRTEVGVGGENFLAKMQSFDVCYWLRTGHRAQASTARARLVWVGKCGQQATSLKSSKFVNIHSIFEQFCNN